MKLTEFEMHHRAKFHQNRSIRCSYIAIFRFKTAAVRLLGFLNSGNFNHLLFQRIIIKVTAYTITKVRYS